jgi:hypothetical protein
VQTLSAAQRARIGALANGRYTGVNDTHLSELLAEEEGLMGSRSTVRRLRVAAGLARPCTQRAPQHRSRRERMARAGMLVQIDGSQHRWLGAEASMVTLLAAVTTLERANVFLPGFLALFKARFAVPAADDALAFRPLLPAQDAWQICCFAYQRVVTNDGTIGFGGQRLQLCPHAGRASLARATVTVREHLDGSVSVWHQGQRILTSPAPGDTPILRARGGARAAVESGSRHPWRRSVRGRLAPHRPIRGAPPSRSRGHFPRPVRGHSHWTRTVP